MVIDTQDIKDAFDNDPMKTLVELREEAIKSIEGEKFRKLMIKRMFTKHSYNDREMRIVNKVISAWWEAGCPILDLKDLEELVNDYLKKESAGEALYRAQESNKTSRRKALREGNPVTNSLPARIDSFLQDVAQMSGEIDYSDIFKFGDKMAELQKNHKFFEDKNRKILHKLWGKAKEANEYDDDELWNAVCKDVGKIVKGEVDFNIPKNIWGDTEIAKLENSRESENSQNSLDDERTFDSFRESNKNRKPKHLKESRGSSDKFTFSTVTDCIYVGDPCYASHGMMDLWGKELDYEDGVLDQNTVPREAWPKAITPMAVVSTDYGDGCYEGDDGVSYGVDSGTICVMDGNAAEVSIDEMKELGSFFVLPKSAPVTCSIDRDDNGTITVSIKQKGGFDKKIIIPTGYEEEDEDCCPYCGSHEGWDGYYCNSCGYGDEEENED